VQGVQLMKNFGMILILGLLAGVAAAGPAMEAASERPLLRDGFMLRDAAGTLIRQPAEPPDSNEAWLFELSSDVNDSGPGRPAAPSTGAGQVSSGSVLKAGTRLELLRSSALERMVADVSKISNFKSEISDSPPLVAPTYFLNGRVTKYKGRNFIFPNYFLPLQPEKSKVQIPDSNAPASRWVMALDEPNDVLAMPPDIIEKLRVRREKETSGAKAPRDEPQRPVEDANAAKAMRYAQSPDSILVDRTALLVQRSQGGLVFSLDALGRNIQHVALRLLPCEALELAEREQSAEPEPVRFRIAGIVTTYKGDSYLLLQKAIRIYSHGNFGR
jgi:hypothetical protein